MKRNKIYSDHIHEKPRERLQRFGALSLASEELIALLIGSGIRGKSACSIAHMIMQKFKTFRNMADTTALQWREFKGVGAAKLARIRAALEIGRRFQEEHVPRNDLIVTSSSDATAVLVPRMRDLKKEVFHILLLDARHRIIDLIIVAEGTVDHAAPIIREVFHKAIEYCAVSLICAHNHPSGNPAPSIEDRRFTKELVEAGHVLGIRILDHIIISDESHFSFADEGSIAS
ncbi:MAG: DNA repair protein RadC [Candidatus Omnitrophica bacterium]|nr:DNA repair protein RadC [Candidatus Omnitrophota bacterium]